MKKISVAAIVSFFLVTQSNAEIINSGNTNTTSGGKTPALQGLDWLTLDETNGQSRDSIESGYGGFISNGWRYASRLETEILLGSLWGGTIDGYSSTNYDGALWFTENFNATFGPTSNGTVDNLSASVFFFGEIGECDDVQSCFGRVNHADNDTRDLFGRNQAGESGVTYLANSGKVGSFFDHLGLDTDWGYNGNSSISSDFNDVGIGSLMVRDQILSPVPEPHAYVMFGLGLLALYCLNPKASRRQRGISSKP